MSAFVQHMNGTDLEPSIMVVPGDVDTDYNHLPIRIALAGKTTPGDHSAECDFVATSRQI
eukprot:1587919-Amphidinium_carterae.1